MKPSGLQPGDVLLFRPATWLGRLVAWATGSEYCHAAMFLTGCVAEMREFRGGRILPLFDYETETIDVFRAVDSSTAEQIAAVQKMQKLVKERYSFLHGIAAFLLRRLPQVMRSGECDHHGYHCSQAISKAYRAAGFDLCPFIPDWATTPGDLAALAADRTIGILIIRRRTSAIFRRLASYQ